MTITISEERMMTTKDNNIILYNNIEYKIITIDNLTNYAINKQGQVLSIKRDKLLKPRKDNPEIIELAGRRYLIHVLVHTIWEDINNLHDNPYNPLVAEQIREDYYQNGLTFVELCVEYDIEAYSLHDILDNTSRKMR